MSLDQPGDIPQNHKERACTMIPHVRSCMRKIRKRGNNSRCHDIAGILEGRRYEARRNTYIYLRFRPLANKRRSGRGKNEVCRRFTFEIEARHAWKSKREKWRQLERKRGEY